MHLDIEFACPCCEQRLVVEAAAAGQHADCPKCGSAVTVPDVRHVAPSRARGTTPVVFADSAQEASTPAEAPEDVALQISRLEHEVVRANAKAEALHARVHEADKERAALRERLAAAENALTHTQEQTQRDARELSQARQQLAAAQAQLEQRARELGDAAEQRAALEATVGERDREAAQLRAEAASAGREAGELRPQVARIPKIEAELKAALGCVSAAEGESARRQRALAQSRDEIEALKRDLASVDDGRELLSLREKLREASQTRDRLAAEARQLGEDLRRFGPQKSALETQLKYLAQKLEDAERRAQAVSDTGLKGDNEVLRGIVDRQSGELAQLQRDLRIQRKRQFLAKALYAACILAFILLVLAVLRFFPELWQ